MLTPLQKFLTQTRAVGKMPIEEAGRKIGGQIASTGRAMADNPRAAVGGGLLGAGAGYLGSELMGEEESREEKLRRILMQLQEGGDPGGY